MDIEHTYDTHITQEIERKKKYDQEKEERKKEAVTFSCSIVKSHS